MNKFLKYLFGFGLFFSLLIALMTFLFLKAHQLRLKPFPAPNLTNSYSMNDKLDFARGKKAEIIAIGSSMSLNNLDSKVITEELKNDSYLNLSSWGMSMSDIYFTLKAYAELQLPKTVIISSNIGDFTVMNKALDQDLLGSFLRSSNAVYPFYFLHHFNLKYYTSNLAYLKKIKQDSTSYEFLRYDPYGAVLYHPQHLKISQARWNAAVGQDPEPQQYEYLEKIADWCKEKKINLLFFQSPVRQGMYSDAQHPVDSLKIKKHVVKIAQIMQQRGHSMADASRILWSDSLFADNLHFFDFGAAQYTRYCFQQAKKP
jgi:hypothetical protein